MNGFCVAITAVGGFFLGVAVANTTWLFALHRRVVTKKSLSSSEESE